MREQRRGSEKHEARETRKYPEADQKGDEGPYKRNGQWSARHGTSSQKVTTKLETEDKEQTRPSASK
jgi:hypothetical protein